MGTILAVVLVLLTTVACEFVGPDVAPTPDLPATVEAAVEATREAERPTPTSTPRWTFPTPTAAPTSTPVLTPEPYTAAPGSVEQGIEVLYSCLQSSEEIRDFVSGQLVDEGEVAYMVDFMLTDQEAFEELFLWLAAEDPKWDLWLSLVSGDDPCPFDQTAHAPTSAPPRGLGISEARAQEIYGMSEAEARDIVGMLYDCSREDPGFLAYAESVSDSDADWSLFMAVWDNKDLSVTAMLADIADELGTDSAEFLKTEVSALEIGICPPFLLPTHWV